MIVMRKISLETYGNVSKYEMKLCACGCGTLIQAFDKRGRPRKYVHGHNGQGIKRSDKTKQKIGKANTGKKRSGEARKKMSESATGRKHTKETRRKIGRASKGNQYALGHKHTKEQKDKISKANKGKKFTQEFKNKCSESKKGIKNPMYGKNFTQEHKEKLSIAHIGENNHNWQGGISFEPYCQKFNNKFKEEIREIFGRQCFICEKNEKDNGRKLSVHHVNYDKNCLCDDSKCEFVPLCHSCHGKTSNGDREYWEQTIISKLNNQQET